MSSTNQIEITAHSIIKGVEKINFSSYITLKEIDDTIEIFIKKPYENMQNDAACFEGVALILKILGGYNKITLDFNEVNWNGLFENLVPEQCHFMRFLYRLYIFDSAFTWFEIAPNKKDIINGFIEKIKTPVANYPSSESTYNPNKGIEHQIEKSFCDQQKEKDYFINLFHNQTNKILTCIHDQYPNGLFNKEISDKNRIFPTGYFDLWGITDNNELCVFELKRKDNRPLGILSELIFYANFALEFLLVKKCIPLDTNKTYRGYYDIITAINKNCDKINAYFLTHIEDLHPAIKNHKKEIINYLNQINKNITYSFIFFDQDEVPINYNIKKSEGR